MAVAHHLPKLCEIPLGARAFEMAGRGERYEETDHGIVQREASFSPIRHKGRHHVIRPGEYAFGWHYLMVQ